MTLTRVDLADDLARILADVLAVEYVDPGAHLFEDLGADSMTMARFCARVRTHADLPRISMKQVYAAPRLADLAALLAVPAAEPAPIPARVPTREPHRATGAAYHLCWIAQLAAVVGYLWLLAAPAVAGHGWVAAADGALATYLRITIVGAATLALACTAPIVAKWLLVGRWRAQEIPAWGPGYLRFWVVRTLVRTNPLALSPGSPVHTAYLRLLGARVGPGAMVPR